MVPEAPLEQGPGGSAPAGPGWFVVNTSKARWQADAFGRFALFEDREAAKFEHLGVNIGVLEPGQPSCMYHEEDDEEDFLVLAGECLLIVEGEERPLKQWDFVHCPPHTRHVFVGAGDGPCTLLAMGARVSKGVVYPVDEVAIRYDAGVKEETTSGDVAYKDIAPPEPTEFDPNWLPGG